jgi:hypothetical protein
MYHRSEPRARFLCLFSADIIPPVFLPVVFIISFDDKALLIACALSLLCIVTLRTNLRLTPRILAEFNHSLYPI